ncbi:hypothetical protein [Anabaena sp. UHCC 0399]|uniref:hypothetical protein n=1 Tax=Anabaena sp. UHCC 0399 TaxID=3110238 RepID=UPI002B1F7E2F|nr:hypothetical protein [Anabaena sp. UHCC 0399]MEA5567587.1 hypothetical protein [Anabaena sp. UHCC 0399]
MSEPILATVFAVSKVSVEISIRLAKALKLIESIESKLDLLMQVEFNAALKTLHQALNSSALDEQKFALLNDARNGFNNATCIEKGERLFYAHLGLAICHYFLNDMNNVKTALLEATKVSIYKDIYLQERNSSLGFNKYVFDSFINNYNPENILNLVKSILSYRLILEQKKEINKYNKSKSNLINDIYKKINAEEKMIIWETEANQPSDVFKTLESKSLEFINLQKECLEIIDNI